MNRSLPPFPDGATDLRLHPVLTLDTAPRVTVDAWLLAASFAVFGGTDAASLARDDLTLPVIQDGQLFEVLLGDLLRPDVDARDVADTFRATLAGAAACALQMRQYVAAADRLITSPAVIPNGVTTHA